MATFVDLKGKKINLMKNAEEKSCKIIGDAMKQALIAARVEGAFDALPRTKRCEMGVENMEGLYGWPAYKDRGKENLI
jgi:hypothetical protein